MTFNLVYFDFVPAVYLSLGTTKGTSIQSQDCMKVASVYLALILKEDVCMVH